jgi:hypothetical protein
MPHARRSRDSQPCRYNRAHSLEAPGLAILDDALRLFGRHFLLLAALVLTVWLPAHAAMETAVHALHWTENFRAQLQLTSIVGAVLDPLVTGAVIYVVYASKMGYGFRYRAAFAAGVACWGRVFTTRLVTGLLIVCGTLLLVVPGVVLALRWALIDAAVVLEGLEGGEARRRSTELSEGRRLRILWTGLGTWTGLLFCIALLEIPRAMIPTLGLPYDVFVDCAGSLTNAFMTIVWVLFFVQAKGEQPVAEAAS